MLTLPVQRGRFILYNDTIVEIFYAPGPTRRIMDRLCLFYYEAYSIITRYYNAFNVYNLENGSHPNEELLMQQIDLFNMLRYRLVIDVNRYLNEQALVSLKIL